MIYDITRTISTRTMVWPGDDPFDFTYSLRLQKGDIANLTRIALSPHTGTHADAFYHFEDDGAHPAGMDLNAYIGPAQVVTVSKRAQPLTKADLAGIDLTGAERVLLHSHMSDAPDEDWPTDYPYLSVELIQWFSELGIVLIGLDSPSVDAFDSQDLPCHHALATYNIANLELLQLRDVPDGRYELVALPLKIDEICGSPVRAILRT